jgi:hypothetical protein
VGQPEQATLAEFAKYLPRVREAPGLAPDDLGAIPVHAEPPSADEFVTLGELPPGAPRLPEDRFPPFGSRQLYAYHADIPPALWRRLVAALAPHQPSGTGGTGMFGTAEERVVDEENPQQAWERFDAGHEPYGRG